MKAINHHPHLNQFHLAKSEMPATRRLASRITSFPRTLLVKSSWAFTPSSLLLLRIKRFGPPLAARQAPRSAQHSITTSAYRGAQRPRKKNPPGVNRRAVLCLGPGRGTAGSGCWHRALTRVAVHYPLRGRIVARADQERRKHRPLPAVRSLGSG